jgi:hypothetical protein
MKYCKIKFKVVSSTTLAWLQASIPNDGIACALLIEFIFHVVYAPIFGKYVNKVIAHKSIRFIIAFDLSSRECAPLLQ